MEYKKCSKCKITYANSATICPKCGKELVELKHGDVINGYFVIYEVTTGKYYCENGSFSRNFDKAVRFNEKLHDSSSDVQEVEGSEGHKIYKELLNSGRHVRINFGMDVQGMGAHIYLPYYDPDLNE
ncbi:hypothetical protein [Paenibacillus alvei]|uniref:hypothetical protein n=1 Tax=Paenibacillus alvei TaxID=44250 RepID=UPI0022816DDE|nr:hypothetical protein [Paenibacillus alvei]